MRGTSLVLAALLVPMAGCGRGTTKTPQDIFQRAAEAAAEGDMKTYLANLSQDSQKAVIGFTAATLVGLKGEKGGGEIGALLARHGLPEEAILEGLKKGKDFKSAREKVAPLAEAVKDGPAFLEQTAALLKKMDKEEAQSWNKFKGVKLGPVTVEGEKAKGKLEAGGVTGEVHFVREEGEWKIDLLPLLQDKGGRPEAKVLE